MVTSHKKPAENGAYPDNSREIRHQGTLYKANTIYFLRHKSGNFDYFRKMYDKARKLNL